MCGSAPSAPQLPQYPNLTPAQQTILQGQGVNLQQFGNLTQGVQSQLGQNQGILQQVSGLYNADGSINQTALNSLQSQTQQAQSQAGTAGSSALNYLNSMYGTGGAMSQTQAAYQNALSGNAPANQQLQYTQGQNFLQMQQQAAQQGINISGTNFGNAVSSSTAGQKLIQNFQQNANMQNQNYQLGYLQTAAQNMSALGSSATSAYNTGMGAMGYATQNPLSNVQSSITNGQGALAPYLSQYQNTSTSAYEPQYMQQIGPYQQQMAQAQANYQGAMGQYNAGESQLMGWGSAGISALGAAGSGLIAGNTMNASGTTPFQNMFG